MNRFPNLQALIEYGLKRRHDAGIHAIPAALYRDLVIQAARAGVAAEQRGELSEPQEQLLRSSCRGIDSLGNDLKRQIYLFGNQIYKLCSLASLPIEAEQPKPLPTPPPKPAADDPNGEPPRQPVDDLAEAGIDSRAIRFLQNAGWQFVDQIPRDRQQLIDVRGIGPVTADEILEAID